jgi:chromate reductase
MSHFLIVPGSLRRGAWSVRLAEELAVRVAGPATAEILTREDLSLPLFDEDLEEVPEVATRVLALHRRFAAADALLIATPEYNGQLPPVLKNLIDWISRPAYRDATLVNPFLGKPVLICTISTGGSGGALAVAHARALMGYVGCLALGETVSVPFAEHAWVDDLFLADAAIEARIDHAVDTLLQVTARCSAPARMDRAA